MLWWRSYQLVVHDSLVHELVAVPHKDAARHSQVTVKPAEEGG